MSSLKAAQFKSHLKTLVQDRVIVAIAFNLTEHFLYMKKINSWVRKKFLPEFHALFKNFIFLVLDGSGVIVSSRMSPHRILICSVQFSSVAQSCPTHLDPMNRSMPGLPVHHQLPESTQTHVHCVSDAIQPSHPLSSPSSPVLNLSQHQGLLKWVRSLHQVAKVLEFQLQHQSFQWTPRTDFL